MANGIPFEYENLALVITGKVLYAPDFFLTMQGEFVELKGWAGTDMTQRRGISMLSRKGFVIHVLGWEELRLLIGSPCKTYKTLMDRAIAANQTVEDYFATATWHPVCDDEEVKEIQKSIYKSPLRKPTKIDKDYVRRLRA